MLRRSLVLFGGAALGFGTFVGLGGIAGAAPTTQAFSFTGAPETFTVPADVCELQVTADGAAGADLTGDIVGGLGGHAQATIAVTPGEVLQVRVGGQGASAQVSPGGAGGFNGGGDGGDGTGGASGGSGGGGASDVRRGDFADASRLVIGGGGGGAGNAASASGGAGGGTQGVAGSSPAVNGGGQPGTQAGPGDGGMAPGNVDGGAGVGSAGGAGATPDAGGFVGGAGGGGGGLFGGGGGSANTTGGGGGGSGFTPDGAGLTTGVRAGDGQVTITFDPAAGGCPPPGPGQPGAAVAVTAAPRFTG